MRILFIILVAVGFRAHSAQDKQFPTKSERCLLALEGRKQSLDLGGRSTEQIDSTIGQDRTIGKQEVTTHPFQWIRARPSELYG